MGMQLGHTLDGYVEAEVEKAALEQARASMGFSVWHAKGFHVTGGMRLQLRWACEGAVEAGPEDAAMERARAAWYQAMRPRDVTRYAFQNPNQLFCYPLLSWQGLKVRGTFLLARSSWA